MDPLFATLVLILLALLGARFSFSSDSVPAGPRLLFRTGIHFLAIGFFLGPGGLEVLTEEASRQLTPLLGLGLGWIGLQFGFQLDQKSLSHFPRTFVWVATIQAVVAFFVVLGGGIGIALFLGRLDEGVLFGILALAAIAWRRRRA